MNKLIERHPIGLVITSLPIWIVLYFALQSIADAIVTISGLPPSQRITEAVRFFVFETPKVILLLTLVVFAVGIVRTYFSAEHTRKILGGKSLFVGNVLA